MISSNLQTHQGNEGIPVDVNPIMPKQYQIAPYIRLADPLSCNQLLGLTKGSDKSRLGASCLAPDAVSGSLLASLESRLWERFGAG